MVSKSPTLARGSISFPNAPPHLERFGAVGGRGEFTGIELALEAKSKSATGLPSNDSFAAEGAALEYDVRSGGKARSAIHLRTASRQIEDLH